jgi:hypothetical protein
MLFLSAPFRLNLRKIPNKIFKMQGAGMAGRVLPPISRFPAVGAMVWVMGAEAEADIKFVLAA